MTAPIWRSASIDIDGDATQNAIGNQVDGDLVQHMTTFVRGRPSMYLGSTEIADRVIGYVPARNHELVVKALEEERAVVLTGPRGCGRETAAIAAIRQLRPGIPIRRFSLEDEDAEEIDAKGSCGYLVHTADGGQARLPGCLDAVRRADGYLAVIGDYGTQLPVVLLPQIAVGPPHPVQVYRRWAATYGLEEWRYWDQAPVLLEQALPADARYLANLIKEVRQRGGDIAAQQAEVTHAYRGWDGELRRWFTSHREPHDRALLVAAAALSPAAEETYVYRAAASLAERLKVEINGSGLAWCPVTDLRGLIEAHEGTNQIVFYRHGYAKSALRHVMADYPLACPELLTWLAELPTDETVPRTTQNSLAGTFADLAAGYGTGEQITETAREWGKADHADLAFVALSRTCLHPRVGVPVRRALYDWSRAAKTAQTLKLTIARVCEPLGQTYPSIALTRLKHLATNGNRQVAHEVALAVRSLVRSDHRAEVVAAVLAWSAEDNRENLTFRERQRRRRVGATLFLEFAMPLTESGLPVLLDGDEAVDPEDCLPGWRAALDFEAANLISGECTTEVVLWRWLDAALRHDQLREQVSSLFVVAARGPGVLLGGPRSAGAAIPPPTRAALMIETARRWAAIDHKDPVRRQIKEAIVIPLTEPWWLRVLKATYVRVRSRLKG